MRFTKLHGCGNDYIYVDCFNQTPPSDPPELSRKISDRHRGVGADGLILVLPPPDPRAAHARMRMFNADGLESEMCGNGVRCLAKFVHDRKLSTKNPLRVATPRGVLTIQLHVNSGRVDSATVDMDEPILESPKIPTTLGGDRAIDVPTPAGFFGQNAMWMEESGVERRVSCVSMGSPHAVVFCAEPDKIPLEQVGPTIEFAKCFPSRMNVHFATVESRSRIRARTWERGTGPTQACGTGACAVAVAAALMNRGDRRVTVQMPGGDLEVDWRDNNHVLLTGPAVEVFSGEWFGES